MPIRNDDPVFNCPLCGAQLSIDLVRSGVKFKCPGCGRILELSRGYQGTFAVLAIGLDVVLLAILGVRNLYLALGVLLAWFPTYVLVMAFALRIVPQKVQVATDAVPVLPRHS